MAVKTTPIRQIVAGILKSAESMKQDPNRNTMIPISANIILLYLSSSSVTVT
jgi:hypothetical protein